MLRPEFKSIAFWLLAASLLAVGGCGSPSAAAKAEKPTNGAALPIAKPTVILGPVEDPQAGDLALLYGEKTVRLGELEQDALRAIPKPARAFAIPDESPFANESIRQVGWESAEKSFGLLTNAGGRVLLALYQREQVSTELLNQTVAEHEAAFGPSETSLTVGRVSYRFWARGNSRLMISASPDAKGRLGMAVAIGHFEVMDPLGMSPRQAEMDAAKAEQLAQKPVVKP